jgi:hypothetical protein
MPKSPNSNAADMDVEFGVAETGLRRAAQPLGSLAPAATPDKSGRSSRFCSAISYRSARAAVCTEEFGERRGDVFIRACFVNGAGGATGAGR